MLYGGLKALLNKATFQIYLEKECLSTDVGRIMIKSSARNTFYAKNVIAKCFYYFHTALKFEVKKVVIALSDSEIFVSHIWAIRHLEMASSLEYDIHGTWPILFTTDSVWLVCCQLAPRLLGRAIIITLAIFDALDGLLGGYQIMAIK